MISYVSPDYVGYDRGPCPLGLYLDLVGLGTFYVGIGTINLVRGTPCVPITRIS